MDDPFETRSLTPMLIGKSGAPFDDDNYLYELKCDGVRCLAYIDPLRASVELRNKRNLDVTRKYPELSIISGQVAEKCILDGEIVVTRNGRTDFEPMQQRALLEDDLKIKLASTREPVSFVAYDVLWSNGDLLIDLPLMDRKARLQQCVRVENNRLAVSRMVEGQGTAFFQLTQTRRLEGIVAKRKDGRYRPGKTSRDWIKIKNLLDDDYVVCGYIPKEDHLISIILGQYRDGRLQYKGHVTFGVRGINARRLQALPRNPSPTLTAPQGSGNERAIWLQPVAVCTVQFMEKTASGALRQPVFKGFRDDKPPEKCVDH